MIRRLCCCILIIIPAMIYGQTLPKPVLTVENIMRDPEWIGTSPSNIQWSDDGQYVYFRWNPENADSDSLYRVSRVGGSPEKVPPAERLALPEFQGRYSRDFSRKVYAQNGDIFLLDLSSTKVLAITNTVERESDPRFSHDEDKVLFMRDGNLYSWDQDSGTTTQLTDFRSGREPEGDEGPGTEQERCPDPSYKGCRNATDFPGDQHRWIVMGKVFQ